MTDITKIREWTDDLEPGQTEDDWPGPNQNIESEITGATRTRIFQLCEIPDQGEKVRLIEIEVEGGWSEFSVEYDYEIQVWIDLVTGPWLAWGNDMVTSPEAGMASFLGWLK